MMSEKTDDKENSASMAELEAAKKEAELAKKEAELAKKEAELAKQQAGAAVPKGGKKKTAAIIGCSVVFVALVGVIVYLLNLKGVIALTPKKDEVPNTVVTEENVEDIMKELEEDDMTPPGSYEVSMTMEWNFAKGSSASKDAYLENVKANNNSVYATVERADTGEEIYKSPIMRRGSHIKDIKLDKVLKKGTYDCVCTYHLLAENEKDEESTTKIALVIKVKK